MPNPVSSQRSSPAARRPRRVPRGAARGAATLDPWRAALALTLGAAALRLALAAWLPLVPDEAYYWEWSRRLAAGYFDHPPGIAALIRAGTALLGDSAFAVRFFPVLAGLGAALLVLDLARRYGGPRAALRAAVIVACVPLAAAGLVLATPDAPLLFAYALALWALDRALAAPAGSRASYAWWTAAGAAVGLGLLSKYTAVLLPFAVLVAFLLRRPLRGRLRTPEPYLAGALALALFAPVVLWNARHGWASFAFQLRHGLGAGGGSPLARQLELLGGQLGLVSPILFGLLAAAVVAALRRGADDRRFVLATVAAVSFGFFVYSALRQRVEPNWPAPAYVAAFVLLAAAARGAAWRKWLRRGCALGAAMVLLIYAHALRPVLPLAAADDPVGQAFGWDALAAAAAAAREEARPAAGGTAWVAANRYQDAAQLAFHLPDRPRVFALNLRSRPNQYDYWPGFAQRARPGDPLVLVLDDEPRAEQRVLRPLAPHFAEVHDAGRVELRRRGGGVVAARRLWILRAWRGTWPAAETPQG